MKRLFARNSLAHTKDTRVAANSLVISAGQQRQFASSPQKNPYGSILTKLSVGSNQFSYYKLPALGDKRIGKHPKINLNPNALHSQALHTKMHFNKASLKCRVMPFLVQ
jgi:hypothetical protein